KSPRKYSDRLQATIEEKRSYDRLHGVREHGALAPQAGAIFAAAQAQMISKTDGRSNFGHVLSAHQLRAHPGQFALIPFRMKEKQGFTDDQAQHSVAEELEAFIVAAILRRIQAALHQLLVGQRTMRERADQQIRVGKAMSQSNFQFGENCFHVRPFRVTELAAALSF